MTTFGNIKTNSTYFPKTWSFLWSPEETNEMLQKHKGRMRNLTLLFFLTFLSGLVKSQNIYSALQLNAEREYKTQKPKKIVETNTFFSSSGKQVDKAIKIFDEAGMLVTEERYDENGALTARLTYSNDTAHRIKLSRVFERWAKFGYSKEIAVYIYDSNFFLVGTTDKDANGNVIRQTNLVNNDKGHPTELSLFDGNGRSTSRSRTARASA